MMLNAPRLDCSLPFAFFLACGNATCGIRGDTDGRRLMHEPTERNIGTGTHRSSLSRTDLARVTLCWHRGESGNMACRQLCTNPFSASPLSMAAGFSNRPEEKIFGGVIFGFVGRGFFSHKFVKTAHSFFVHLHPDNFGPQLPVSCSLMSGAQHCDHTRGVVSGPGLQIAAGISRATTSMIPATRKLPGS